MLPQEAIEEYRQIILKEKGILLTLEQATEEALVVFNAMKVLLKPSIDRRKEIVQQ